MIVALFIDSEAGDRFPYIFQDKPISEIAKLLYNDLQFFAPIGGYDYIMLNETEAENEAIRKLLQSVRKKSEEMYS